MTREQEDRQTHDNSRTDQLMTREQADRPTYDKRTWGQINPLAREQRELPTHDKSTNGQTNSWQENKRTKQHLQVEQHLASKNHLSKAAGLPGLKHGDFNNVDTSRVHTWFLGHRSLDHKEIGVRARTLTKLRSSRTVLVGSDQRAYIKVNVVVVLLLLWEQLVGYMS